MISAGGCAHAQPGQPLRVPPVAGLPRRADLARGGGRDGERGEHGCDRELGRPIHQRAGPPLWPREPELRGRPSIAAELPCADERLDERRELGLHRLPRPGAEHRRSARSGGRLVEGLPRGRPSPCFRGAAAGGYAKKHNPFIYYDDIASSPVAARGSSASARFQPTCATGRSRRSRGSRRTCATTATTAAYRSRHRFLARTLPALVRELGPHGFLVLTWDEGSSDAGCCGGAARGGHIATVVIGPDVRRGARESAPVDHFGVLGTIEQALGLPPLARRGRSAQRPADRAVRAPAAGPLRRPRAGPGGPPAGQSSSASIAFR